MRNLGDRRPNNIGIISKISVPVCEFALNFTLHYFLVRYFLSLSSILVDFRVRHYVFNGNMKSPNVNFFYISRCCLGGPREYQNFGRFGNVWLMLSNFFECLIKMVWHALFHRKKAWKLCLALAKFKTWDYVDAIITFLKHPSVSLLCAVSSVLVYYTTHIWWRFLVI